MAWVACVSVCVICICMSLYAGESTYVRGLCTCVSVCVREKRANHTRSPQGYHLPTNLLQEIRLAMLCDLVGWGIGAPPHTPRVAVLSNRVRREGGGEVACPGDQRGI